MKSNNYCEYCKHNTYTEEDWQFCKNCGKCHNGEDVEINFEGIEVEPVRHGHWIIEDRYHCQCSVCKKIVLRESTSYEYCPRCIAKMDGEVNVRNT